MAICQEKTTQHRADVERTRDAIVREPFACDLDGSKDSRREPRGLPA